MDYDDVNLATKIKMSVWLGAVILLCLCMLLVGRDYVTVMHDFQQPGVAWATEDVNENGEGRYNGVFYGFELEGNTDPTAEEPTFSKADFYLFGMKMNTAVNQ